MAHQQRQPPYPRFIANYLLGHKLGAGFSGAIFCARNIHTNKEVALKLQPIDESCPTNKYERGFYPALQGGKGMPTLWASGTQGPWDYLAIDLLGRSLDSLHRELMTKQDVWDLRSVCCIAVQVIDRLRFMHTRGVLHRDIQLGNCVLGLQPQHKTIYMIDFGFSKFYIDQRTGRHIPDSNEPRDFIGNYWFSSVRVHCRNKVPSRRDDMEALALMLIHLLTPGGLHWTRNGVPKTDEAHDHLIREKRNARPEDICRGLPPVFEDFLRYCRKLDFAVMPDYQHWIEEFRDLADEYGLGDVEEFVWPSPFPEVPAPKPTARMDMSELKDVLDGLANLQLGTERQVLAERNNLVNRDSPPALDPNVKDKGKGKAPSKPEVIDLVSSEDDDDENARARARTNANGGRLTKAARLAQLSREMAQATDNRALGRLVREFAEVMQENRSKMLTKEGFAVLDALHKQLADPSVFVAPLRTKAARASGASENDVASGRETRQGKMNKLYRLGLEVRGAGSNTQLAGMVAEFGRVIDRSNGRTVTKDGFGFLNALAARIEALS
ncbi:CK1/CK1 protein kinase [Dichomitus squalens]|uniref:CK1/CK1 protein kinase n=1 Tax=Dichomitus squalens TaxID=114155 RepID=A0A4Q9MYF9_9APHY|nr:CK1/CK1 protein kinase [Dichomitus squalens]